MGVRATFQTGDLDQLAVLHFGQAGSRLNKAGTATMRKSVNRIEKGMKVDAGGHRFLPSFASQVTTQEKSPWSYSVGWRFAGQGNLAHIIVRGSVNNAPVYDHTIPARRELSALARDLAKDAEQAVFGGSTS